MGHHFTPPDREDPTLLLFRMGMGQDVETLTLRPSICQEKYIRIGALPVSRSVLDVSSSRWVPSGTPGSSRGKASSVSTTASHATHGSPRTSWAPWTCSKKEPPPLDSTRFAIGTRITEGIQRPQLSSPPHLPHTFPQAQAPTSAICSCPLNNMGLNYMAGNAQIPDSEVGPTPCCPRVSPHSSCVRAGVSHGQKDQSSIYATAPGLTPRQSVLPGAQSP